MLLSLVLSFFSIVLVLLALVVFNVIFVFSFFSFSLFFGFCFSFLFLLIFWLTVLPCWLLLLSEVLPFIAAFLLASRFLLWLLCVFLLHFFVFSFACSSGCFDLHSFFGYFCFCSIFIFVGCFLLLYLKNVFLFLLLLSLFFISEF